MMTVGILEYAGIQVNNNNNNNNLSSSTSKPQPHRDADDCTTCDMNKNAISKLVTTTDKLLLRNVGLVEDNETLAQAVVVMNAQREENAKRQQDKLDRVESEANKKAKK
jgi:hypothetical protein